MKEEFYKFKAKLVSNEIIYLKTREEREEHERKKQLGIRHTG
jgi:hypothetical protein